MKPNLAPSKADKLFTKPSQVGPGVSCGGMECWKNGGVVSQRKESRGWSDHGQISSAGIFLARISPADGFEPIQLFNSRFLLILFIVFPILNKPNEQNPPEGNPLPTPFPLTFIPNFDKVRMKPGLQGAGQGKGAII